MATEPASAQEVSREPPPATRPREIALAALLTALLFLTFLAVPLLGTLALPFAAVPAVRLTHRHGTGAGLFVCALAACLLLVLGRATGGLAEALAGAFFAAVVTAVPAFFSGAVRRGLEPSRAYLSLCVAGYALLAGGLMLRAALGGPAMREGIRTTFEEFGSAAVQSYSKARLDDAETIARLKTTLQAAEQFARRFWVGLVGVSWVLGAAVGFYAGARMARPAPSVEAIRFESLRIRAAVAALFVAAGAGTVLGPPPAREVAGDLLLPLSALYFVAGLSIICHFARKWFRARILRVGLYALVLYFPINAGVALLGLFDWYADFRRRGEGATENS